MKILYKWLCHAVFAGMTPCATAQHIGLSYASELQYDLRGSCNWVNLLCLEGEWECGPGKAGLKSIHIFKTDRNPLFPDRQTFSNIEEENLAASIAVMGYTLGFGKSTVFAGIRNVNEDYFISPVTSLFTNSSCGIYPTLSLNYPLANYPLSTWCMDYKFRSGGWCLETSLYNGAAHKGFNKKEHVFMGSPRRDGVFSINSVNYDTYYGSYHYGFALHNRLFPDFQEGAQNSVEQEKEKSPQKKMNFTWWCYLEQSLFREAKREGRLLVQFSRNECTQSVCRRYAGIGFSLTNLILPVKENTLGLFVNRAVFADGTETACEFTWRIEITPMVTLQPAVHKVFNPEGSFGVAMVRLIVMM